MVPLTLRTGIATLHGSNLLDTPCAVPEPLLLWLAAATAPAGSTLWQGAAKAYRTGRHDHYAFHPQVQQMTCNTPGRWKLLGAPDEPAVRVSATGRLIGGCLETISMLPGSSYGDVADFASRHAPEGLLVYVEVAEAEAVAAARMLHHLRLAGWFDHANAVLVGRSAAPPSVPVTRPASGPVSGGRSVSVTITSGGVLESRYSGGSWDISHPHWALSVASFPGVPQRSGKPVR